MRLTKKTLFMIMALCLIVGLMTVTAFAADDEVLEPSGTGHVLEYHAGYEACHANGMSEYWYCAECDVVYADNGEGTLVQTNRMNLTIPADTELVHMDAVEACHANGSQEYWFCPECEAVFADAEGTQLTNRMNLTIPADTELVYVPAAEACHVPGSAEYWYCPDCEAVFADEAGTQLTNRKRLETAPVCGLTHVEAVDACHVNGSAEYWYCEICEAVFIDEAGTQLSNRMNLTIPADSELEHVEAVAPMCHSMGNIEHWFCPDCGGHYADAEGKVVTNALSVILPATGEGDMVHYPAVAPTATKDGNVEYWYCNDCETYYADAEGKIVTNAKRVILPATGEEDIPVTADYSIVMFVVIATVAMAGVVVLNKKKVAA